MATIEDILKRVNSKINTVGNQVGNFHRGVTEGFIDIFNGVTNAKKALPKRVERKPIASMEGDNILMSTGEQVPGKLQLQLRTLRKNVLDQNQFTPQARNYLEQIDVKPVATKNALGTFSTSYLPMSPVTNFQREITINPEMFSNKILM